MANDQISQPIRLSVADVSGQKLVRLREVRPDSTVGELLSDVVPTMRMPRTDTAGRPMVYHARLEREGRHLHAAERVGDAVQIDDQLVILPNIDAGSVRR